MIKRSIGLDGLLDWRVYTVALVAVMFGCAAVCTFGRIAGVMP
jgi:hypothetical protein